MDMTLVAFALGALFAGPGELTDARCDAVRAAVLPDSSELRWREIPWRPSFQEAIADAQRERRPILLWAMNGHPLGCT